MTIRRTKTQKLTCLKGFLTVLVFLFGIVVILTMYYFLFFLARGNFREVVRQRIYRSAQPSPEQLENWVHHYGIRTVINLRGYAGEGREDLQETANKLSVAVISIPLSAYKIPKADSLAEIIQAIEENKSPILIHCRDGIDRTGTVSAIAAMAIGNMDYDIAKWQAYVAPGPWKRKKLNSPNYGSSYVHISDLFKFYENYCKRNHLETNSWQQFKKWAVGGALDRN